MGSTIVYKAPVDEILSEGSGGDLRAVGVRLRDGREVRGRCVVSNATRWNTFGKLLPHIPRNEAKFRELYVKAPSFISLHLGVSADCVPVRAPPLPPRGLGPARPVSSLASFPLFRCSTPTITWSRARCVCSNASAATRLHQRVCINASAATRLQQRVCINASVSTRLHQRACINAPAAADALNQLLCVVARASWCSDLGTRFPGFSP